MKRPAAILLTSSPKAAKETTIRRPAALPQAATCGRALHSERVHLKLSRYYKEAPKEPSRTMGSKTELCHRPGRLRCPLALRGGFRDRLQKNLAVERDLAFADAVDGAQVVEGRGALFRHFQ